MAMFCATVVLSGWRGGSSLKVVVFSSHLTAGSLPHRRRSPSLYGRALVVAAIMPL